MAYDQEWNALLKTGVDIASEIKQLLKEFVTSREDTISELRCISDELQKVSKDVNIAKISGHSAGIVGGLITVGGAFLSVVTFGIGVPVVLTGIVLGAAGSITSSGAKVANSVISKDKIEKAQKKITIDSALIEKIKIKEKQLNEIAERIAKAFETSKEVVFSVLFLNENIENVMLAVPTSMPLLFDVSFLISNAVGNASHIVGHAIAAATLRSAWMFFSRLSLILASFTMPFEIKELINTATDFHKGSRSAAEEELRRIAKELEKDWMEGKKIVENFP